MFDSLLASDPWMTLDVHGDFERPWSDLKFLPTCTTETEYYTNDDFEIKLN